MRKVHPKRTKNQRYIEKRTKGQSVLYICLFCCFLYVCLGAVTVPSDKEVKR
nr:MAG TPA: hypothetical protein [Caudoviricetes sp.]